MLNKFLTSDSSKTTLLIRLMVGVVFLSEGMQKFLFPAIRGVGRFESIGLPSPEFLAYFVASFEILCGILILLGLLTRFASLPLLIIMLVALVTTKIPIFLEDGLWVMLHAFRTDFAMTLGSIFLIIKGGGYWSLDEAWFKSGEKR